MSKFKIADVARISLEPGEILWVKLLKGTPETVIAADIALKKLFGEKRCYVITAGDVEMTVIDANAFEQVEHVNGEA